jgi:hypothetical protein
VRLGRNSSTGAAKRRDARFLNHNVAETSVIGISLGPCEILDKLGAGRMGASQWLPVNEEPTKAVGLSSSTTKVAAL